MSADPDRVLPGASIAFNVAASAALIVAGGRHLAAARTLSGR
jgi:hypothetical protein